VSGLEAVGDSDWKKPSGNEKDKRKMADS